MDTATVLTEVDPRCGSRWLAQLDDEGRRHLLIAVFSRFNHDLRTPLNTILGWTHLLQKGGLEPARLTHVADVIGRNSRDQTQLLEEFVDDGRAILGALKLTLSAVCADDLVTRAIERLGALLTLHGASVSQDFDGAKVSVEADPRRLERLVYRLLSGVTRRAREASAVTIKTGVERGCYQLSISGVAFEPDWSDAALLDLRISTLMAALHSGELHVGADATRPCIQLKLPRH